MHTPNDVLQILGNVKYLDWTFHIDQDNGRLSPHMTKSEVVSTAFKAVLTAVEHEARETFRYRGKAIFGPHFNVDALVVFAGDKSNIDLRTGEWVQAA